jgi:hypothetical protein
VIHDDAWKHNNWLIRFLKIQRSYDRKVYSKFVSASVRGKKASTYFELSKVIEQVFVDIADDIYKGKQDAAEAAVRASFEADRDILARVFPNRDMRKSVLASAISRARANVSKAQVHSQVLATMRRSEGMLTKQIQTRKMNKAQTAAFIRNSIHPRTPGGVAYHAMRLLRTDLGSTFHSENQRLGDKPWIAGFDWHLSRMHRPSPGDPCETYAKIKKFGKEVPGKPHPNCMCYLTERRVSAREIALGVRSGAYTAHYLAA